MTVTEQSSVQAVLFKNDGNKALLAHQFDKAVELYTKAIELDPTKEVYFANRAQAHIKNEAYGFAIEDATRAIELNPAYTKAYYRRAVANTAIVKHKAALQDFKSVVQRAPNDKDARMRLDECQKIIRRLAFERAIAGEETGTVADSIDLTTITMDDSYDGVRIDDGFEEGEKRVPKFKFSQEFLTDMIERFKNGKLIHRKYVFAIILEAMKVFNAHPTMVETPIPTGNKLTVCGDTHGQYFDLLEIFRLNGMPSETNMYLFNGDFVDRGSWSCEIALVLYTCTILYPTSFFINRGNHETDDMNRVYGFEGECKSKYNEKVFKLFSESFSALPLATLVANNFLVLHGGLFSDDSITLDHIRQYNRFNQRQPGTEGLMMEMLWTDPREQPGRGPSGRGVGIQFGPDVTHQFCEKNNLRCIIRSHEVRMGGYEQEHNEKLVTVFSAPNYCDSQGNKGAYITIAPEDDYELHFNTFDAVVHPDIKPMAYASRLMN